MALQRRSSQATLKQQSFTISSVITYQFKRSCTGIPPPFSFVYTYTKKVDSEEFTLFVLITISFKL